MSIAQLLTVEDVSAMELPEFWELIEGELFALSPSTPKSSAIALKLGAAVLHFVESNSLGEVFGSEGGFKVESDPDSLIAPDVTYVARKQFPSGVPDSGFPNVVPDFAIEILSPSDRPSHIRSKQALYARVGIPLVWWVDPTRRQTVVQRPHQEPETVTWDAVLDGEQTLPGFQLRIADVIRDRFSSG